MYHLECDTGIVSVINEILSNFALLITLEIELINTKILRTELANNK